MAIFDPSQLSQESNKPIKIENLKEKIKDVQNKRFMRNLEKALNGSNPFGFAPKITNNHFQSIPKELNNKKEKE